MDLYRFFPVRVTAGLAGDAALVHLDMPRWFRASEPVPCLRTVAEALHLRRYLALEYRRGGGGVTSASPSPPSARVVGPLGLVKKAGIWYLVAVSCDASRPGGEAAGASRPVVFRVGRIAAARVLAQGFERTSGFDLAGFWAGWSAEFEASRPLLPVSVRASPRALAAFPEAFGDEIRQALDQAPADAQGWRVVGLSFEHEMAAAHRLAGFGSEVEVLSPASVRARLLAVAHGIIGRYGAYGSPAMAGHDDASGTV
jgi:predicted DNA-binding transcriptional regulator YafY